MTMQAYVPSMALVFVGLMISGGLVIASAGTLLAALAIPQARWSLPVARALRYATIVLLTWSTLLLFVLERDAGSPLFAGDAALWAVSLATLMRIGVRDRAAGFGFPEAGQVVAAVGFGIAVAGAVAFWLSRLR